MLPIFHVYDYTTKQPTTMRFSTPRRTKNDAYGLGSTERSGLLWIDCSLGTKLFGGHLQDWSPQLFQTGCAHTKNIIFILNLVIITPIPLYVVRLTHTKINTISFFACFIFSDSNIEIEYITFIEKSWWS